MRNLSIALDLVNGTNAHSGRYSMGHARQPHRAPTRNLKKNETTKNDDKYFFILLTVFSYCFRVQVVAGYLRVQEGLTQVTGSVSV